MPSTPPSAKPASTAHLAVRHQRADRRSRARSWRPASLPQLRPNPPHTTGPALSPRGAQNLAAADRALEITQRSLLGQVGSLGIGFFLWGAGGFFARIIRDYRKLYPGIKLSLYEMRTPEQMEALTAGKIDLAFARPLEPPFDQTLRAELLYQGPPSRRPSPRPPPRRQTRLNRLSQMTPALYDGIVALCSAAGFSPNIINTAATWSSVLTLVESGEGVALVPSGVRYLRPTGVVFSPLVPQNLHIGLAVVWNPQNEDPIQQNFLRLVRDNKDRIQRAHGN